MTSDGGTGTAPAARRATVLGALLGAGLVILAGTRTWVTVSVADLATRQTVTVSGRQASAVAVALALATAAGAVVLATAGRAVRFGTAVLLGVAGLLVVLSALAVVRHPEAAVRVALAGTTGVDAQQSRDAVRTGGWPWVAVAGGLLTGLAGLMAAVRGGSWPAPSVRYQAPAPGPAGPAGSAAATAPDGGRGIDVGGDAVTSAAPDASRDGGPGPAPGDAVAAEEAWNALSRGVDPT